MANSGVTYAPGSRGAEVPLSKGHKCATEGLRRQLDGPCETGAALAELVVRELWGKIPNLFFFKSLTRELQCPAVLRDRANDVIRGT